MKSDLRSRRLYTVCEEARCPNQGECWERKTATFMILGDVCTRHCRFCSVTVGRPSPLDPEGEGQSRSSKSEGARRPNAVDPEEPAKVADMVSILGLKHVVVTCVARDDLEDGGAGQFVRVIEEIRRNNPTCVIEILTTDFQLKNDAMETVCRAKPDVFNHNIETVERLSPGIRHRAGYRSSLEFLRRIKAFDATILTKSGLMVGLGEETEEVAQAMRDLRSVGCEILTIGQYLQPTSRNLPVVSFIEPELFLEYEKTGYEMGFRSVASGPFVRSSYWADELVRKFVSA